MSFRSLQTTLTLYRSGTLTLKEAATRSKLPQEKIAAELRSRGIPVREEGGVDTPRERRDCT